MAKTVIQFQHTGHFWNDLGVIALWRWMAENAFDISKATNGNLMAEFDNCECILHQDYLEVSGEKTAVYAVLHDAIEALKEQVAQPSKTGKIWWTGPSNLLYTGQKPDFLLRYEQLPKKSQWRRRGHCDVCHGESNAVRTTGTAYNPLLVSVDKMSGFYSELKGGYQICQPCAFVAPFALTQAWYSWGDQFLSLTLLWPVGVDLLAVDRFLQQTTDLHIADNLGRNYKRAFNYANSATACFLDLICSSWTITRTHTSADVLAMALAGVQFHAMQQSKPSRTSNVVSIDRYEIIPDPMGILRLVQQSDHVSKQGKIWNSLISILNDMPIKRRGSDGKIQPNIGLLNQIADAIVARSSIEEILERRIYEALDQLQTDAKMIEHFNVFAFRLFVPIYFKEVKYMSTNLLSALQSVGETLGELVKITDDRGILYNLRNARNADDLLEVLSRVVVRYSDAFIERKPELWRNSVRELTEFIDNNNWHRARSLLGLYAGLKFIELSQKSQSNSSTSTNP